MAAQEENEENEFMIKNIRNDFLSDECFTPGLLRRNTQPTIAKQLVRVDGTEGLPKTDKIAFHPTILEKLVNRNRHFWTIKPGKDDYVLHEIYKKYSVNQKSYNPKDNFRRDVFCRPYNCELDFIEQYRKGPLEYRKQIKYLACQTEEIPESKEMMGACKLPAPFWWNPIPCKTKKIPKDKHIVDQKIEMVQNNWRPPVNPILVQGYTSCQRKAALQQVGLPYQHEACLFYNEHYPTPKLKIFRQSFS